MKYILDFDRVIFDTDRFVADLRTAHIYDSNTPRTVNLLDEVSKHGISIHDYLNPGAMEFLQQHRDEIVIVSSFFSRNEANNSESEETLASFQLAKIERALADVVPLPEIKITARDKSGFLRELYKPGCIFLDDEPENIETARELGYRVVWFATPKKIFSNPERPVDSIERMADIPSVSSFEQFTELVKSWESSKT